MKQEGNSALASMEERAALLRAGFTGKEIESLYIRLNGIIIADVNLHPDAEVSQDINISPALHVHCASSCADRC